ncbi:1-aminocyclopropane-1-carboxylate deaminase/D-cysteine desulfhydrase [Thermoactinomyces mirandus]|uniref:D-cysteine desulfhydrase family protein n=1 Tax=Thermoactinomyces mirandus TaxID=2756294 RepID=A0A7W2ARH2_9BACL|nr:D-cysteine desulfhydrase family protein [Thermoactinomyces mirandus]MBA4602573.1 D-cysteine desulfhydrase family protein [Thermoactinomyces mirandus]
MKRAWARFPIIGGMTPIQPLPRLARLLGIKSLWIKRDDLTGLAFGGNKLRKLEYLIGEALEEGCDLVLTGGSPQSNHARLTTAVANKAGLEIWLFFAGSKMGLQQGNLLLNQIMGAEMTLTGVYGSKALLRVMEEKADEARKAGRKPYVIPVGGSTPAGDYGYFRAWQELEKQCGSCQLAPFDEIYVAVGTGGTLAGLLAGILLHSQETDLMGISVWKKREPLQSDIHTCTTHLLKWMGEGEVTVSMDKIKLFDQYIGKKYGVPSQSGNEAIRLLAQTEGIFVDPVYTGKALAGLINRARQGLLKEKHVLFWHTGGTPALFTHHESLLDEK